MNSDKFLNLYRELESCVRSAYNLDNNESMSYFLSHNSHFVKYQNEIRYMSDIRNLLSHNPKINGDYAIDISDETINFISQLIDEIKHRKKVKDIMVPINKVYFGKPSTKVINVISDLSKKIYNHVPIKDSDKIIGVFDEIALFNLIRDGIKLDENLTFNDIKEYIRIKEDGRVAYLSIDENEYVDELKSIFNNLYTKGKRVGLVFVKNHKEDLVGIISTTDILGK